MIPLLEKGAEQLWGLSWFGTGAASVLTAMGEEDESVAELVGKLTMISAPGEGYMSYFNLYDFNSMQILSTTPTTTARLVGLRLPL